MKCTGTEIQLVPAAADLTNPARRGASCGAQGRLPPRFAVVALRRCPYQALKKDNRNGMAPVRRQKPAGTHDVGRQHRECPRLVVDGGMTRRGVAKRFGIAPSTAINWVNGWHRSAAVRDAIQGAGAELRFLPRYSPDFNRIEMAFSKLKASLKRRAARTLDERWEATGEATDNFSPAEVHNHFAAAGYDGV